MAEFSESNLPILFQDEVLLAVNKPSGLHSQHQESKPDHQSAEAIVKGISQDWILLHRLDAGTSGVLLFARNPVHASAVRDQFRARTIGKFYHHPRTAIW